MKLFYILIFPLFIYANSNQGYIDMHGGKSDKLYDKRSNFSTGSSFSKKSLLGKPLKEKKEPKQDHNNQDKNNKQQ